jgi:hypothetical protein
MGVSQIVEPPFLDGSGVDRQHGGGATCEERHAGSAGIAITIASKTNASFFADFRGPQQKALFSASWPQAARK